MKKLYMCLLCVSLVSCNNMKDSEKVYKTRKETIKVKITKVKSKPDKIEEKDYYYIIKEKPIDKKDFYLLKRYNISEEFLDEVKKVGRDLNIDYAYILKIISFETQRTFSTTVRNRYSGAIGLIQFMPDRGKKYKTINRKRYDMSNIEKMDYKQQLFLTKEYLLQFHKEYKTLPDLYMAVLYPRAIDKKQSYTLFKKGTKRYSQNRELDLNKDGRVTKKEITRILRSH